MMPGAKYRMESFVGNRNLVSSEGVGDTTAVSRCARRRAGVSSIIAIIQYLMPHVLLEWRIRFLGHVPVGQLVQ